MVEKNIVGVGSKPTLFVTMPERASVGDAVPIRTLPHPDPLPEGEGKNVGGPDVPLRILPHPDPLPKGEGKNVGGPDVPLRILPHPDPLPKGKGNCTSIPVGKIFLRIRKYSDRNGANEIIRYNNCRSIIPQPVNLYSLVLSNYRKGIKSIN